MDEGFVLSLREGVSFEDQAPDRAMVAGPETSGVPRRILTFKQLTPALREALGRLASAGETEDALSAAVLEGDGAEALFKLHHFLERLAEMRLLCHTVRLDGRDLATIDPSGEGYVFRPEAPASDGPFVLSRFALVRRDGAQMVLESPLGHARVFLRTPEATGLAASLSAPRRAGEVARAAGVPEGAARSLLTLFWNAGALSSVDAAGQPEEDGGPVLPQWEFHDLLFHSRSRLGRHANPYGGTFRFKGRIDPLPAIRAANGGGSTPLHRPTVAGLRRSDPPFTAILEDRRSLRDQGERPLGTRELGEFLYRSARVTEVVGSDKGDEMARRPYPGGGGLYELEVYLAVDRCEGLTPGLYRYDPLEHVLGRLEAPAHAVQTLLEHAWHASERHSRPQVLVVLAARFQRVQWKYESVSYAVILKDVGVVLQTMYLVATAMGLAPCALGGGDSDLFASAAGLDYYAETSVGELILGSRKEA